MCLTTTPNPVTHTLFMDDLKIYTGGPEDLEATLTQVERVAEAVGMRLGIRKCRVAHLRNGRLVRMSVGVGVGTIEEIEPGTPYR